MTATNIWDKLAQPVSIAPLVTFRIVFGLLMFCSILRFWWNGWITDLYVTPAFHFTYWGFEWVKTLGDPGMHLLFGVVAVAALFITAGYKYRLAAIVFFLGFTYIELIDIATYLNHYYFISLMAFLLIWLPAGRYYSFDVLLKPKIIQRQVPFLCIGILRFQMAVVYVFAGLAKLNPDWMLEALPLAIWLPAKSHIPLVGQYLAHPYTAYLFSWFGAVYDLFIVFFLLSGKTRWIAYTFVLLFHTATAIFFPGIGMFPYVMMTCSLIFFSGNFHDKLLSYLPAFTLTRQLSGKKEVPYRYHFTKVMSVAVALYITAQLIIPFRYLLYPGHLFWHEAGFRFSWRVMLMEKSGAAYFKVKPAGSNAGYEVNNSEFLTPLQEKMMSTQPDMILQYAHFLAGEYEKRGVLTPQVYADIYVSLNGRHSAPFVDPTVDLAQQEYSWKPYNWVLPYQR